MEQPATPPATPLPPPYVPPRLVRILVRTSREQLDFRYGVGTSTCTRHNHEAGAPGGGCDFPQ